MILYRPSFSQQPDFEHSYRDFKDFVLLLAPQKGAPPPRSCPDHWAGLPAYPRTRPGVLTGFFFRNFSWFSLLSSLSSLLFSALLTHLDLRVIKFKLFSTFASETAWGHEHQPKSFHVIP